MDTQVPESFDGLDAEALAALEEALAAEFDARYEASAPLDELGEIADALDQVRNEQTARAEASEAEQEQRAELAARVRGAADDSDAEAADGDESADADAEAEAEADADAADGDESGAEAADEQEEVEAAEREPVAASGRRQGNRRGAPSARAMRRPAPQAPAAGPDLVITASADVPGFANGQTIDRVGIATAMHARSRGLGDSKGARTPFGVASITKQLPEHLVMRPGVEAEDLWKAAVAEQLGGGQDAAALVASGGWCAPSTPIYETFGVEAADGLIDLPTIGGGSRGGITWPEYIGLDATDGALWTWSEANDISPGSDGDATKPCLTIPCPTWLECRLGAEGLCVTHGNLADRAYPEGTARFVDLVMTAHAHRLSNAKVASIVAGADAVTVTSIESDAAGDILSAIDLQLADYRSEHLMSENVVLEGGFPQWFIEAIRATLAARAGVNLLSVSNQQVRSFFTDRNVRPQFLAGYEPLYSGAAPATAWPGSSKFLLWPSGGYGVAEGGTIDLGVVRDSTLNETNDFTAAWSEEFYCVAQRGPAAREVTVTTDVDGVTACCPVV